MSTTRLPLLVLFCALAGCDAAEPPGVSVRDSAGIAIIEHEPGYEPPVWTLSAEPRVVLGGLDADPDRELYQALHAFRLSDGRIVVANQGTNQLRFYDGDGSHLRTVGREGGGPGEYRDLRGVVRATGDSLVAWDWTAKRLTVYDDSGEFGRVVRAPAAEGFSPRLRGLLNDTLVAVSGGVQPGAIFAAGTGPWEDSVALLRIALADGSLVDTLGPFPGDQRYAQVGERSFWARRVVFGRQELLSVAADRIHVGDDRSGEVRVYDSAGHLVRIIRTGLTAMPVTDAALARFREDYLADMDDARLPEERRRLDELPVADRMPAFDDLFVDRLGRTWVRVFDPAGGEARRWLIFDADGRAAARLDLHPRARPVDAGQDYALLRATDQLDVERLMLYGYEPATD